MSWDEVDRTEETILFDEIEENAQQIGILIGKNQERRRIRELAETWISEMRGHDGDCSCRHDSNVLQNFIEHGEFNA